MSVYGASFLYVFIRGDTFCEGINAAKVSEKGVTSSKKHIRKISFNLRYQRFYHRFADVAD